MYQKGSIKDLNLKPFWDSLTVLFFLLSSFLGLTFGFITASTLYFFVNNSERLRKMYLRISKSHSKSTARVAIAREMLKVIYYILRDKRPFRVEAV